MHCSTLCEFVPILPRGLAVLFILGLLLHTSGLGMTVASAPLPPLPSLGGRWHKLGRRRQPARHARHFSAVPFAAHQVPRVLARGMLLLLLLHTSGWLAFTVWSSTVLLLPLAALLHTLWGLDTPASAVTQRVRCISASFQRLYQVTLVLLLLSSLLQLVTRVHAAPTGFLFPLGLTTWVTHPDDATEIRIDTPTPEHFIVTLRGTFQFAWAPRDGFEQWMLLLFLRRLQGVGATSPYLSQTQVAEAFGSAQPYVSRWEQAVQEHGWHVLSDRYRHQLGTAVPNPALSRAILQVWVPAFWLSAWDVRERLLEAGHIPTRTALSLETIHGIAHHTGFQQVRSLLLERFDFDGTQMRAHLPWWTQQLFALNERLLAKLERGESLTPQELVDIEPLRLKTDETPVDSAPPPLAATLKHPLFDLPQTPPTPPEPIRCTYCDSDQVAPKSKTPRLKTVLDEQGEKHRVEVLRYYCHNPACAHQTFTHLPAGYLPHSPYPVQTRLVAVELYVTLLSTYRRGARLLGVVGSTVYHWVASVSPAALSLAAYLGAVRTSGVVGIDDKWIRVCSPSAVRPHGRRPRTVWRYAYFAVDCYSYDLLALELYPEHSDEAVRLFLLELKAKGLRPRIVVSDLDPAYGRMLPLVFPQAVHHECIFHAIQNAHTQMTQVYGRYYLEKVPETAPLHEAITQLFQAQTQKTVRKRFAALLELRSSYVMRTPDIACVFDSLERHFPKLVNAIESADIPRTNNATELVIRRFDQHYQGMCGLDSFESAQVYLRIFELVYRLTPFMEDNPGAKAGKCPLELAGYDLKALPIADFLTNLKLPALSLPVQPLSQ